MKFFSKQVNEQMIEGLKDEFKIVLFDHKTGDIFFAVNKDGTNVAVDEFIPYGETLRKLAEILEPDEIYPVSKIYE